MCLSLSLASWSLGQISSLVSIGCACDTAPLLQEITGRVKLTYKRVHIFSTFGKMPLQLWSLHSHNYGGYPRLLICILAFYWALSWGYSIRFDKVTLNPLGLLHLNPFVSSISKHKISSSNILCGLICLINTM
jgi:hypothetical protein